MRRKIALPNDREGLVLIASFLNGIDSISQLSLSMSLREFFSFAPMADSLP